MAKKKIALYWAASCGGCDVAVLDINEKILDVAEVADIVLWPIAMDFKYADVEKLPDEFIDVCFFNGAVRNTEQDHIAKLLRKKSKVMVAFGSCACFGGIPALANFSNHIEIMERAYLEAPSNDNSERVMPQTVTKVKEGELELPELHDIVHSLADVVKVDYCVPGCPPTVQQILQFVEAMAADKLPVPGAVFAAEKSLCDECPRAKKRGPFLK